MVVGLQAEIWTWDLPDMQQECYTGGTTTCSGTEKGYIFSLTLLFGPGTFQVWERHNNAKLLCLMVSDLCVCKCAWLQSTLDGTLVREASCIWIQVHTFQGSSRVQQWTSDTSWSWWCYTKYLHLLRFQHCGFCKSGWFCNYMGSKQVSTYCFVMSLCQYVRIKRQFEK